MICFCNSCYAPLNSHYEYARAFNNLACQCLFSTRRRCHEFVWILSQFCLFPLLISALESVSFGESAPFFFRKHLHSSRVWIRTHLTRKCCKSHFIMDKCGCLQSSRRALNRPLPQLKTSSRLLVPVCGLRVWTQRATRTLTVTYLTPTWVSRLAKEPIIFVQPTLPASGDNISHSELLTATLATPAPLWSLLSFTLLFVSGDTI